ncbi:NADH-ubiquinone oxidoreductase-F iron-sulfur binding region domain-containing protein [Paludibacter jiangxiensis]|uniref:NADH-quinone oxidoreductase subunit F n=1 Tax=Paludibacter jiangxiensis TaxID=681398 RepID=A0A171ARC7_9BACT|nr:NADH-ubiquinone oxidoreductase-F iron-sulfur binding region domain-containing protein [Paludibacter jiangxiensis]GAT64158.1 NADH-quinone oxidoreductase subunit F [Paludibacter jiangxiensis]
MTPSDLDNIRQNNRHRILPEQPMIMVGMGTCGIGNGADLVFNRLQKTIADTGVNCQLKQTGCFGFCAGEPLVMLYQPNRPLLVYSKVDEKDASHIIDSLIKNKVYLKKILCRIDEWDFLTSEVKFGTDYTDIPHWNETPFFKGQTKIVLRHTGLIDPEKILDYIAIGGYRALAKVLTNMQPTDVVDEVLASRLRGRGGAGFPTGTKWSIMQKAQADQKYIICNADEGDPGAYMNRNEIESDPHMLIEGMLIGAYAMGASEGIAYVRAEYPLAVKRLKAAIEQATAMKLLGNNILGTNFSFNLEVVEGAGAFVCGEETALIASIEGKAGRPMPRPPYPAQKGLYGKPTNINNVETWCNIPVIIEKGSEWFKQTGTEKSSGTKVFSLVGKVKNTGLVELPLGSTIEQFVFNIGEGTGTSKRVKAVQTGGPSGGCIPLEYFSTPVDYESLASLGAIMGSGGMVVMDQDNCMVDVARYFLEFNSAESCGKCTPCREGLAQALAILTKITKGEGTHEDLTLLEQLSQTIRDTSICALGQTAPNPILTTLKYFRNEYEEHIREKRCHAGACEALYMALCENSCPLHMNIPGYIELMKEDRIEDAFELTLRDNPIPGTIGRICHFHCQMRCRREMIDEPVSQGEIHRYLADTMYKLGKENEIYKKLIKEKLPSTGKKIAIIGAGPAGLTAAYYLVRLGHSVTIYDALSEAGGVVRFGIPQYRLPKSVLQKEVQFIKRLGVQFVFNTRLGTDIRLSDLDNENDAIYLAIGAWKDIDLNIPGEHAKGVFAGTEVLKELALGKIPKLGQHVVIIGAGNVAIDAARSIWRLGKDVTVVYRREKDDMPANKDEIMESEAEHITYRFLAAPHEIITDKNNRAKALKVELMSIGHIDTSGRRKPLPTGQYEEIPCDSIILAVGERVDTASLSSELLSTTKDGRVIADQFSFHTSRPKVYAGGDAVTGPSTAAEAMGMAKKAAEIIDFDLMHERRFYKLFRRFDYRNIIPTNPKPSTKNKPFRLSVKERTGNFHEVASGLTGEQAHNEANRCLRCDIKCEDTKQ